MTIVAWDGHILAADSQLNDEKDMRLGRCRKIFRLKNKALLGTAGDGDDRDMRALLAKSTPRRLPTRDQLAATKTDFHGILVFPKGQAFFIACEFGKKDEDGTDEWIGEVLAITDRVFAVGHGKYLAYGALDAGKNAIETVRIVCGRDTTCALPVQYEKL